MNNKSAVVRIEEEMSQINTPLLRLDIRSIKGYARKPRRHTNPEYDRIKASIQVSGLDQPLIVTQPPGESGYLLMSGGNTRLKILKELYQESGQTRFQWLLCHWVPWSQESDVLLAHLRENELRGGLHFIDKAQAVFDAKQLFEEELGLESLTFRDLAALCRDRGFHLNPGLISKLGYAVRRLLPLIPKALSAGLGRPQVEKIRALDRATSLLWKHYQLGDGEAFDDIFSTLCQRYDTPDWDLQSLRQALENEVAAEAEQSLQVIRVALDAALAGRELPSLEVRDIASDDEETVDQPGDHGNPSDLLQSEVSATEHGGEDVAISPSITIHSDRGMPPVDVCSEPIVEIGLCRSKLYRRALTLAENHGFGEMVIRLPDNGLGFLLSNTPTESLGDVIDEALLAQVSTLWWQLFSCADMAMAPVELLAGYLDVTTPFYQALAQHDIEALSQAVLTLRPDQMGHHFWRHLSDIDWETVTAFIETYRQLHGMANGHGIALWQHSEEAKP